MPLVSCLLATKDRPNFLRRALTYYKRQTLLDKELVIIDDSADNHDSLVSGTAGVRYVRLRSSTALGTKLNIGMETCAGEIIQKIDDDDYYAPHFLEHATAALISSDRRRTVVGSGEFLVFLSQTGRLVHSGKGWFAGGTLCFYRDSCSKHPFRDEPSRIDVSFLEDHCHLLKHSLNNPELYMLVRHGRNTWQRLTRSPPPRSRCTIAAGDGRDVTEFFEQQESYHRTLEDLLEPEDASFYRDLSKVT